MSQPNSDVFQIAVEWYVTLSSGEATVNQKQAWQEWVNASPEHAQAWHKLENVTKQFSKIEPASGMAVLSNSAQIKPQAAALASRGRRQAIKQVGVLVGACSLGWLTYHQKPWQTLMADYATETGKQQQIVLQDGTQIVLNTNSLVAIHYTAQQRNIELLKGEILIETAQEQIPIYRPLSVITEQGKLTALGTRFSVKITEANGIVSNDLNVYQGTVSVQAINSKSRTLVNEGEFMRFTAAQYQAKSALDPSSDAWIKGFIVVDKMPLEAFVDELSRYKTGVIKCDSSISQLEISGAYPLNDIDATLVSVSKTLSLRVETFTRYWLMLKPA